MKTLAITAAKGGVGKSTLSVHLATLASSHGWDVLIADLDPQRSAGDWRDVRDADTPLVAPVDPASLDALVEAARGEGIDLLVIDTPPHAEKSILPAAMLADLALVPTRPAPFDLRAIGRTLDMLATGGVTYSVVLNATPPKLGSAERGIVREARAALAGHPVCPVSIAQRVSLSHALISGGAVHEYEPRGKAARELGALWKWAAAELDMPTQPERATT